MKVFKKFDQSEFDFAQKRMNAMKLNCRFGLVDLIPDFHIVQHRKINEGPASYFPQIHMEKVKGGNLNEHCKQIEMTDKQKEQLMYGILK